MSNHNHPSPSHEVTHHRGGTPMRVFRFDSMGDMARTAEAVCNDWHREKVNNDRSWHGGCSWADALQHANVGTTDAGADVAALMEKLPAMPESIGQRWDNAVAGQYPDVARFVAGHPDAMRARRHVADTHNPLHIIVDPISSSGINAGKLKQRGAAILAVASAMSAVRPVTLSVVSMLQLGDYGVQAPKVSLVFRVCSSPLDMSLAAAALQCQGVARGLMHNASRVLGGKPTCGLLTWAWDVLPLPLEDGTNNSSEHAALMRQCLEVPDGEPALCIPAAHLDHPSISTPEQWVADMLALYAPGGELAAA